jgi:cyclopropane fatty-acyl-phospholipid synthase-like methyltransferase
MRTLTIVALLAAVACVAAAALLVTSARAQSSDAHRHHFRGADKWAQVFDDPKRDEWQKPQEVIAALALAPDARVADLGAGTGYFAVRLARAVARGRVYGVDVEPDMVRYLGERALREGLANVTAVQASAADPKLPEPVDLVLVVDTYHHIGSRETYFRNLRSALRPGGRVAIIDFTDRSPVGPPKSARIAPGRVQAEMRSAGYTLVQDHALLPYQYFLVFAPTP